MVRRRDSLLLAAAMLTGACATAPPPRTVPTPAAHAAGTVREIEELRRALEEAHEGIEAREAKGDGAPLADVEAAASLEIPDHRTVRSALDLFTNRMRDDIQTYLSRSRRYKLLIEKTLRDFDLPKAFVYLPVIESGYSPTLTSRAGARGIWQLMPATAREYGLRVDWWVDERSDPEKSTRVAAAFLRDLYRQFRDWPLVIAAYNAGPGRVRRALEKSGSATFWELLEKTAVPKETRGYVPTFYATLLIAGDPQTHGFRLDAPERIEAHEIFVEGPLSLAYVAKVAEVDEALLREMNPAYRRGVLPPGRSALRLPPAAAARIAGAASALRHDDDEIEICTFTLRRGDTLERIAAMLGTSVDDLVAMNDLGSPERARPGRTIYVPVRARELASRLAQNGIYYAVKKGDTLYSIARRHDLTVDELRDLNDLARGETLRIGQKLLVTQPRTVTAGGM